MPAFRAFAFDAYGTLFDVLSVTTLCEQVYPGHGAALAQLWRSKQLQYSVLRSLMERYENFWRVTEDGLTHAAEQLGLALDETSLATLMDAYRSLDTFPDVRPGLETLKRDGARLAILSNGAPRMLRAVVEHAGIGDLFDCLISADEVRVFKPSPRVYALLPPRLGLRCEEIGFVSSNSWDVCGAASAGFSTFWIRRSLRDAPDRLDLTAGTTIGSLLELSQ